MTEIENEEFISCKKFKSSHQQNEEIHSGGHKGFAEGEAGNYFLGPVIKEYIMAPVTQCLARRKGTDDYYLMKILVLDDSDDKCSFVRRTVFHNEYSFLSLLRNHPGVIQLCDFFKDYVNEENAEKMCKKNLRRICMVLECLIPHGHHNPELIPLNHYLKGVKLSEVEALYILYNLLLVLQDLHSKNIVHRDLKFSNIILNRKTLKVKLTDFYLAELLTPSRLGSQKSNQCRTSSQDGITENEGVLLKICDMHSVGVILFGMLNGSASKGDYSLSNSSCVSDGTKELLRKIQFRLEASEAVDMVSTLLAVQCSSQNPSLFIQSRASDQVVPQCPDFDSNDQSVSTECSSPPKKKSLEVSEVSPPESEISPEAKAVRQRGQKPPKGTSEETQRPQTTPLGPKSPPQNALLGRKEIKFAMLRLGVTSVNSINAVSFNYCKKNSCRS